MRIHSVTLRNFRNYESLIYNPNGGLNILLGGNAQGKSAVLEAVYLLATTKSHRTRRDCEMIRIGAESARVFASVEREKRNNVDVEVALSRAERKSVRIGKVRQQRVAELLGELNAVVFDTGDIAMLKGEPAARRAFLDLEVSQVSPQYAYALGRYRRTLEQRNRALSAVRDGQMDVACIDALDLQLVEHGTVLVEKRRDYLSRLAAVVSLLYAEFIGGDETLRVDYRPALGNGRAAGIGETQHSLGTALRERRNTDLARGITSVGPHRDDVDVQINQLGAREYASQGQLRSAAVAMKLAEVELIEEQIGESPVVLLDDVMAELDASRRVKVLSSIIGRCQILLTTTNLDEVDRSVLRDASVFRVSGGRVERA